MTHQQATKIEKDVRLMKREVRTLRSLFMSILAEDTEGLYHPSFIRSIKKASDEQATETFSTSDDFLLKLRKV